MLSHKREPYAPSTVIVPFSLHVACPAAVISASRLRPELLVVSNLVRTGGIWIRQPSAGMDEIDCLSGCRMPRPTVNCARLLNPRPTALGSSVDSVASSSDFRTSSSTHWYLTIHPANCPVQYTVALSLSANSEISAFPTLCAWCCCWSFGRRDLGLVTVVSGSGAICLLCLRRSGVRCWRPNELLSIYIVLCYMTELVGGLMLINQSDRAITESDISPSIYHQSARAGFQTAKCYTRSRFGSRIYGLTDTTTPTVSNSKCSTYR